MIYDLQVALDTSCSCCYISFMIVFRLWLGLRLRKILNVSIHYLDLGLKNITSFDFSKDCSLGVSSSSFIYNLENYEFKDHTHILISLKISKSLICCSAIQFCLCCYSCEFMFDPTYMIHSFENLLSFLNLKQDFLHINKRAFIL